MRNGITGAKLRFFREFLLPKELKGVKDGKFYKLFIIFAHKVNTY